MGIGFAQIGELGELIELLIECFEELFPSFNIDFKEVVFIGTVDRGREWHWARGQNSCGAVLAGCLELLQILVHHHWAIDTFAPIEFGDAFSNFRAGFFDPDLLFVVEACEELEGDSQDFFGVGITPSGELGLDQLFVFSSEGQHGWNGARTIDLL
jgi:hypothetical protein